MLTDRNEFRLFFQEYLEPVSRLARRFAGDPDVARDAAQEAFVRLYERKEKFESREKAKSFLYTTAKNYCLDYLKHRKVEQQYYRQQFPAGEGEREEADEGPGFLHEITYQETLHLVHAAIKQLSPRGRAIILHGMNGKNNAEIAEAMHISVNTVKTLKKGAYATLRELLKNAFS
ncbi:MAG: sigma-70 family RNA polymerase sigma factor, partial [Odoribacteraceae bacterium]|nr:sigma-70 family RNA polymerase sigma factor [Odoribacteraceae bacterium]